MGCRQRNHVANSLDPLTVIVGVILIILRIFEHAMLTDPQWLIYLDLTHPLRGALYAKSWDRTDPNIFFGRGSLRLMGA